MSRDSYTDPISSRSESMKTKEQLQAEIAPLQAALHRITDAERKAESTALIGKCFKYHNSYGGDRPKWWLYLKVYQVSDCWPIAFAFQIDCQGHIDIRPKDTHSGLSSYIEIPAKEFNAAWRKVQQSIAKMKP